MIFFEAFLTTLGFLLGVICACAVVLIIGVALSITFEHWAPWKRRKMSDRQ